MDKELVTKLRKTGLSYKAIGKIINVSKQRIHQIITGYVSPYNKPKGLMGKNKERNPSYEKNKQENKGITR